MMYAAKNLPPDGSRTPPSELRASHAGNVGTATLDAERFVQLEKLTARILGHRAPRELEGQQWRNLLHQDSLEPFDEVLRISRRVPGVWTEWSGPLLAKHPFGGWTAFEARSRQRTPSEYELTIRRSNQSETAEGWDAIAFWLGVSERTARRWAAEQADPMPIHRSPSGRVHVELAKLLEWRDRRDLDLLCGWDAIAAHLGVSERTARRWRHRGLPVERRGGRWVGKPDALKTWRQSQGS